MWGTVMSIILSKMITSLEIERKFKNLSPLSLPSTLENKVMNIDLYMNNGLM